MQLLTNLEQSSTVTTNINDKRLKIGIVCHLIEGKNGKSSFGITLPYYQYFSKFGDIIQINPLNLGIDKTLDLLVLPGGPDVDPIRYGARPNVFTGKPDIHREYFDMWTLPRYIKAEIPVFGICRGHQTLAVHFGAKLYQHIWHPSNDENRDQLVHGVYYNLFNEDFGHTKVNSIHHQVVAEVPKDAVLVAFANTDDFQCKKGKNKMINYNSQTCDIEALYYPNHKCASVQWHPEELDGDIITESLINWLLNS